MGGHDGSLLGGSVLSTWVGTEMGLKEGEDDGNVRSEVGSTEGGKVVGAAERKREGFIDGARDRVGKSDGDSVGFPV